MDAFGWSTRYAAEPCLPSCPSDDDGLLSTFMCTTSFHEGLHGSLAMSSSQTIPNLVHCQDGTGLFDSMQAAFIGHLDTAVDMLPSVTGAAVDDGLFDAFAYVPNDAEGPAKATVSNSNTVFSCYSSTAGGSGGNISSGESNTCGGGHDIEVASQCAVSRPTLLPQTPTLHPSNKRKLGKYPASCASATTATAELRRAKRAAVLSSSSTSITFGGQSQHHHQASGTTLLGTTSGYEPDAEAMAQVKEMIYRAAAMRPVHQVVRDPSHQNDKLRRKNVQISSDPQTVAARLRRERVSERLRVLQRLVPGGSRMDTASMLDEAASYLKFLKSQLEALESAAGNPSNNNSGGGYCNGSSRLLQNYMRNDLGGGGTVPGSGGSTVIAFGSRVDGIGGYVKSDRTMPL